MNLVCISDLQVLRQAAQKLELTMIDIDSAHHLDSPGLEKVSDDTENKFGRLLFLLTCQPRRPQKQRPAEIHVYEHMTQPYFICLWDEHMGGYGLVDAIGAKGRFLVLAYLDCWLDGLRQLLQEKANARADLVRLGRRDADMMSLRLHTKKQDDIDEILRVARLKEDGTIAVSFLLQTPYTEWLREEAGREALFNKDCTGRLL